MHVVIKFSGDLKEIYRYEHAPLQAPKRQRQKTRNLNDRPVRPPRRTPDNTYRTRKDFIRLVRSNLGGDERPAFLTLTMRDIVSIKVGYSCLTGFITSLRSIFGKDFRYIAVPEFQKRGAVHFHILIWGLPEEIVKNERRTRILQNIWALGFVDILLTDGSPKLAGYLGKYMSKSMLSSEIGWSKAYVCSRNVLRPLSFNPPAHFEIPKNWEVLTEREYEVPFLGKCHYTSAVTKP